MRDVTALVLMVLATGVSLWLGRQIYPDDRMLADITTNRLLLGIVVYTLYRRELK